MTEASDILAENRASERAGQLAQALKQAEQALELARLRGDRDGICGDLVHVAVVRAHLGQYGEAARLAGEALTFADQILDSAHAYNVLGACAMEMHRLARAKRKMN